MEEMEASAAVPQLVDDFLLYVGEIKNDEPDRKLTVEQKIALVNKHSSADVCDFFMEERLMDSPGADVLDKQFTDDHNYELLCEVAKWLQEHPTTQSPEAQFPISLNTIINIRNTLRENDAN